MWLNLTDTPRLNSIDVSARLGDHATYEVEKHMPAIRSAVRRTSEAEAKHTVV